MGTGGVAPRFALDAGQAHTAAEQQKAPNLTVWGPCLCSYWTFCLA